MENTFGSSNGILPGYQYSYGYGQGEEAYVTMIQVAAIQSAISAMGVRYNMGAYSLNATQRVLMPDAVLASQSGICIETAILMASVLQSADMHPMIVFTPGHVNLKDENRNIMPSLPFPFPSPWELQEPFCFICAGT